MWLVIDKLLHNDNYLNLDGLSQFLNKLKITFAAKEDLKGLSTDDVASELIQPNEPDNQKEGNYWLQEY